MSEIDIWEGEALEESYEGFSEIISEDYFSSPVCTFRRVLDQDIPEIETIVTESTLNIFGNTTVEIKIKRCYYSMVALNTNERIVAVICLDDHPNIPALPKSEWELWIIKLYGLLNLNSQNTLWIHLLACHPNYTYRFVKPLLKHVYSNFPYLIHIVLVLPGGLPCFCFLEENFTSIMPIGYYNPHKVQTLHLALRYHYLEKYKIRLAVEEDNDDIVQIIDEHSTRLREIYGDFYVSEILTKFTDMNRKIIVAELAERAVGVLFLNGDLNYDQLIENFHLEPFTNLHVIDDEIIVKHKACLKNMSQQEQDVASISSKSSHVDTVTEVPEKEEHAVFDDEEMTMFEILDLDKFGLHLNLSSTDVENEDVDLISVKPESLSQSDILKLFQSDGKLEMTDSSCQSMLFDMKYKRKSAFVLEIMAAGEQHEQEIICDLLEASFQSFTKRNKDYCVFSTLHNLPHFPLVNFFVRAIPRMTNLYPRELYVLHKNAIKACLKVKKISRNDYLKVKNLISNLNLSTVLLDTITKSLFGADKKLKTFVIYNQSVLIGLMVVREEQSPNFYFEYYKCYKYVDLAAHRYDRYGLIQYCTMSPMFYKHMQFFLREVHRISDMCILFYLQHKTELSQKTRMKPLAGILKDMIPVLHRTQPYYRNIHMPEVDTPLCTTQKTNEIYYSLFISTRRLCSLPRVEINNRIVVVGSSYTSKAFLETLITHFDGERAVNFNNLFLIYDRKVYDSSNDLNYNKYIPLLFLYRGKSNASRNNSASFRTHVNYIRGFMTAIDRKNKYITINKETILPYDYLFLMCGAQYHQPYESGARKDKVSEPCPRNFFVISQYIDADIAFRKLYKHMKNKKNRGTNIIVYGSDMNTYACLCVLEKMHLPQTSIKFVEPIPDEYERPSVDPFNNPAIYDAFQNILFLSGIEVYTGYYFFEWERDMVENIVHHVKYQSRRGAVSFKCDFIFHYANRDVKHNTFTAVNNAGLVYDGKLVIGPDCRTNDPYIYAAGPMTKYSRRYFADRFIHKYYSPHEIGERLAKQFRAMLLPGGLEANKGDEIFDILKNPETNKLVPQYTHPVIVSCLLPGNINYFEIRSPGKPIPLETQKNTGLVFETGSLKNIEMTENPEYFRITFGKNHKVNQIVCFTRSEIEVKNYEKLWGQHEQCLNNLFARYKKQMITNFYEYFRDPCFCAIYLDKFSQLQNNLKHIMVLLSSEKGKSMIEDIIKRLIKCNWSKVSKDYENILGVRDKTSNAFLRRTITVAKIWWLLKLDIKLNPQRSLPLNQESIVKSKFINSPYQSQMIEEIMKFLEKNYDYLPMYAHPLITNVILYDVESSPLFKPEITFSMDSSSEHEENY